jgi:hypothetical protein
MIYTIKLLCLLFSLIFLLPISVLALEKPSVAFFYGEPLDQLLYLYDWVVFDPKAFPLNRLKEKFYLKKRAKLIAYFSVGEVREATNPLKSCLLGKNKEWGTFVLDLRKPSCFNYQLRKAKELLSNYDGIFLDTLNSYQLVLPKKEWPTYEKREIAFVETLKREFPNKKLIINGQFRIFPKVRNFIDAFVTESLFFGLGKGLKYAATSPQEREHRLKFLKAISEKVPVIVIDYLPNPRYEEGRSLAKKILSLGFVPWITNKSFTSYGEGTFHLIDRDVLLVYDADLTEISDSDVHRLVQMPLEWLGYSPSPVAVRQLFSYLKVHPLPRGVVFWNFSPKKGWTVVKEIKWLRSHGVKVFIMDVSSFTGEQLKELDFKVYPNREPLEKPKVTFTGPGYGFEIKAFPVLTDSFVVPEGNYRPLLILENGLGQKTVPVAITPWGGYGTEQYLVKTMFGDTLWVFDPFKVFSLAFGRLPVAPDVTTESGRRILTVHLDGDGFVDLSAVIPGKFTGEVLRDLVFKKYKVPHAVSVIVGEVAPNGLYPKKSRKLMEIARSIFSLPNVEPASHTFSHPFNWRDFYLLSLGYKLPKPNPKQLPYGYYLKIPGYKPSIEKEIDYSVEFINRYLTPPNKKVKDFLWSGDCDPPAPVVRRIYDKGLYNVNGGDTTISDTFPYLSRVSPMGINKNGYFQIYSQFQNENVYTNEWQVKDGYLKVISGFKLTETPRRLKPISIYYHFYSGEDPSAFRALNAVYRWALSQQVTPMYLSEFAQRVLEFRGAALAYSNEGEDRALYVCTSGELKTVRVDSGLVPSVNSSNGVVGYNRVNGSYYVSLSPQRCRRIVLVKEDSSPFRLVSSNGVVTSFEKKGNSYFLTLRSETDRTLAKLYLKKGCKLYFGEEAKKREDGEVIEIESPQKELRLEIYCQG